MDDNMNNHIFFTNSIFTFNCSSLWYFADDSIISIMYEIQALISGWVTLHDSKSPSMRQYNNPISFFDIIGELVSNLNLQLKPECDVLSGIDISLVMCEWFFCEIPCNNRNMFPITHEWISCHVFVCTKYTVLWYIILITIIAGSTDSSYVTCCGTISSSLSRSTDLKYSGPLTLLSLLIFRSDFVLLLVFFNIDLCGPTLLLFLVSCRTTLVKTTSSNILVVESTWLRTTWVRN